LIKRRIGHLQKGATKPGTIFVASDRVYVVQESGALRRLSVEEVVELQERIRDQENQEERKGEEKKENRVGDLYANT
jgi:hypothetical protein